MRCLHFLNMQIEKLCITKREQKQELNSSLLYKRPIMPKCLNRFRPDGMFWQQNLVNN